MSVEGLGPHFWLAISALLPNLPHIAGVHFVLRGKNAGNFELLSLISKSHATVVSVPGGGTILCSSLYDICCLLSYKFQE